MNSQLLVDKWLDDYNVEYSGTIDLQAGQNYDIKLEYFENTGGGNCHLSWSSAHQPKEAIPQSHLFAPFNQTPTLAPISPKAILAGRTLTFTNVATDPDVPTQKLTFSLLSAPAGATLNPTNGVFGWRPTIAQGGSGYLMRLSVTDSGTPAQSATQAFTVTVIQPSQPQLTPATLQSNALTLSAIGDIGPDYIIEASDTLPATNWQTVFVTNSPPLPFLWSSPSVQNAPQQFYRVRLGP